MTTRHSTLFTLGAGKSGLSFYTTQRDAAKEQGADFLLTVKGNQKTLHRQIRSQFQGKRHIPFTATAAASLCVV